MTTFELDHVFVCVSPQAKEARSLIDLGLTEGTSNQHPGQGTACRRFFFRNAMLELLWLTSESEAASSVAKPLALYNRCSYLKTGASPFGICVRPVQPGETDFPFDCWSYRPPYLPEGSSIYVSKSSSNWREPLLFYSPQSLRQESYPTERRQPIEHSNGICNISLVRVALPEAEKLSAELLQVSNLEQIELSNGNTHHMEIVFDSGRRLVHRDLRPVMPLALTY